MKVISTESSQILGSRVASALGVPIVDVRFSRFPDGELYLQAGPVDPEMTIVGSIVSNDSLVQLMLLVDACEGAECRLVVPYMGYARQDKRFHPGEPLSARAIARAISTGVSEVITVNIHEESVLGHFEVPARSVSLAAEIGRYLNGTGLEDPLVLAPDEGAMGFAAGVATLGGWETDHLVKTRISGDEVSMAPKRLDVSDRDVFIVDDIISTGGTIATAAGMLSSLGARSVSAACVHGVLSAGAYTHLTSAGIRDLICSDTIERGCSRISASPVIVEALLA